MKTIEKGIITECGGFEATLLREGVGGFSGLPTHIYQLGKGITLYLSVVFARVEGGSEEEFQRIRKDIQETNKPLPYSVIR